MEIIRPMCLVEEGVDSGRRMEGYRKQLKNCPYGVGFQSFGYEELLRSLEAINPEARYSLWGSMTNIQEDYLPRKIR